MKWRCGETTFDLNERPLWMGIVNATPDSFSDGYEHSERAIERGRALLADGADILDVGGESTRPGSSGVSLEVELERVLPVIEVLAKEAVVSVDTQKPEVARAAIAHGARIVNHVSATLDHQAMAPVIAKSGAGYVAMHMPSRPKVMQNAPAYKNLVSEVTASLAEVRRSLQSAGAADEQVLYDPGVGFGKTLEHNLELMSAHAIERMADELGRPLLMGISRKSWMAKLWNLPMEERDAYTAMATVFMPFPAAAAHRLHEVKHARRAWSLRERLLQSADISPA